MSSVYSPDYSTSAWYTCGSISLCVRPDLLAEGNLTKLIRIVVDIFILP